MLISLPASFPPSLLLLHTVPSLFFLFFSSFFFTSTWSQRKHLYFIPQEGIFLCGYLWIGAVKQTFTNECRMLEKQEALTEHQKLVTDNERFYSAVSLSVWEPCISEKQVFQRGLRGVSLLASLASLTLRSLCEPTVPVPSRSIGNREAGLTYPNLTC